MSTPDYTPTQDDLQALIQLVNEANHVGCTAASMSAERLRKCVDVGLCLIRWKATIPHGKWLQWTESNLPNELSKATRERWMKLASLAQAGKLDLESARGLRHAYQLADLLPHPDPCQGTKEGQTVGYLSHLSRLVSALNTLDLTTITPAERDTLKVRLKPIVEVFTKL